MRYCPEVPFGNGAVFCYPELQLAFWDNVFLVVMFSAGIAVIVDIAYRHWRDRND